MKGDKELTKAGIERDLTVSPYYSTAHISINNQPVELEVRFTSQYNIPKYHSLIGRYSAELPITVAKKLNVNIHIPSFLIYLKAYLESERRGFWVRVGDKVYKSLDDIKVVLMIEKV